MSFDVQTPLKAFLASLRTALGLASPVNWLGATYIQKRHSREGGNPYDLYASQYLPDRLRSMSNILWIPFFKGMTAIAVSLMLTIPANADDDINGSFTATSINLNEDNPKQKNIGKLKYIKGYHLTSDNEDFGGISGLGNGVLKSDSIVLQAITDKGFVGTLLLTNKKTFKNYNYLFPIPNLPKGLPIKKAGDAEATTIMPLFGTEPVTLISYEQSHRILAYQYSSYDEAPNSPLPLPAQIEMLPPNGGIETMEALSDGRLLLMAEHPTRKTKQHLGWIGTAPKDDPLNFSYETRLIAPPKGYSPTDATELPNGDVLVLLRRYTPIDGVSAKFWRIKKNMLDSSDPITGEVIATLAPPLTVDNMEGIAVIDVSEDGNPIIAVISDDNFNPLQRTLLMIFEVMK